MRFYFEEVVQIFEIKKVGAVPKLRSHISTLSIGPLERLGLVALDTIVWAIRDSWAAMYWYYFMK